MVDGFCPFGGCDVAGADRLTAVTNRRVLDVQGKTKKCFSHVIETAG